MAATAAVTGAASQELTLKHRREELELLKMEVEIKSSCQLVVEQRLQGAVSVTRGR